MPEFLKRHGLTLLFAAALLVGFTTPLSNSDIWFHLRVGEDILRDGRVPTVDRYSHTAAGAPYLDQSWLSQVLFRALYAAGRETALILATSLCISACFLVLLGALGRDRLCGLAVLLPVVSMAGIHGMARPHILGWLFMALQIRWMAREGPAWRVPALLGLWANCHPSFVLGVGMALLHHAERKEPTRAAACLAAPLLNPYGFRLYAYYLDLGLHKDAATIDEMRPFPVSSAYFCLFACYAALAAWGLARTRPVRPFDVPRLLVLAALGFSARRHAPVAMIYLAPIQASAWAPAFAGAGTLLRRSLGAGLAAAMLAQAAYSVRARDAGRLGVDEDWTPVAAASFLDAGPIQGLLFNDDGAGGYLIWRARRFPVFMDGRLEVYRGKALEDWRKVMVAAPGWEEVLDRRGVACCFVGRGGPVVDVLCRSAAWELVYWDDAASIFVRTGAYPSLRRVRLALPGEVWDLAQAPGLIEDLKYLVSLNPRFHGGRFFLAKLYWRQGDFQAARRELEAYFALYPRGKRRPEAEFLRRDLGMPP